MHLRSIPQVSEAQGGFSVYRVLGKVGAWVRVTMQNQMEKNMDNEMEAGVSPRDPFQLFHIMVLGACMTFSIGYLR